MPHADASAAAAPAARPRRHPLVIASFVLGAANLGALLGGAMDGGPAWWTLVAMFSIAHLVVGIVAFSIIRAGQPGRVPSFVLALVFGSFGIVFPLTLLVEGCFRGLAGIGGAWGRPLRVRGRQRHPELCAGVIDTWTEGERPDAGALDADTRAALEALWLHDAQKEHASVPAFARVSWILAAVGAPADLLAWAQRAALEEIDHTRLCFALAAGYGGRSHSVEAMPELLVGDALGAGRHPLRTLAVESLTDGCQLEDFNADVAAACAAVCEEPVTRRVLAQIAREERSHAELSWAIVAWVARRHPATARAAIDEAEARLARYPRPTAVAHDKLALVRRADAASMRRHGRLDDEAWAAAWQSRLAVTRVRLAELRASTAPDGLAYVGCHISA